MRADPRHGTARHGTARHGSIDDHPNVQHVEAIIDQSRRTRMERTAWFATTAGLVNPLLPEQDAVEWITTVAGILADARHEAGSDAPLIMAGNPKLLAESRRGVPADVELHPLGHGDTVRMLNSAKACLTPPGLTTVLEAFADETPVLFLPEQRYGHDPNYRRITAEGADESAFPEALLNTRIDRAPNIDALLETRQLAALLLEYRTSSAVRDSMVRSLVSGMSDVESSVTFVRGQRSAATRLADGVGGAEHVVSAVESVVECGSAGARIA